MPTHAVLRASAAKCQLIPSIDTRLTSQSTLYQHLDQHLDQHLHQNLINIQWTLNWHLHWQSVEDRLIFAHMPLSVNRYIWVGQHSTNYWPTVNKVLIEYRSRFWSSVGLLSTEYQSRCWSRFDQVSIKGRLKYWSGVSESTLNHGCLYYTWSLMPMEQSSTSTWKMWAINLMQYSLTQFQKMCKFEPGKELKGSWKKWYSSLNCSDF